jgi:LysM repeat protein
MGVKAQKQTPQQYIEKYKDLAIIEMYRSGVPASVTLAQGIIESSSGNSRLATQANNHFGIKCKSNWTGMTIKADDDAPNECFRAYDSPYESYKDHSDFLRSNWRYHPLFELERTDYVGWCRGLKKAGYATNPQYAKILINLIEKYELHTFDKAPLPGKYEELEVVTKVNNIPVKVVKPGETVEGIAKENSVRDRHIRRWNDLPKDYELQGGEKVFLKPKRRKGGEASHLVEPGETMWDISQKYGIKLKVLYRKNRMDYGTQPAPGQKIEMQRRRSRDDEVELAAENKLDTGNENAFVNPHQSSKSKVDVEEINFENPGPIKKSEGEQAMFHVVQKGDNIYRIAERYQVFEEDILEWNKGLNPSSMSIGQKIRLIPPDADTKSTTTATTSESEPFIHTVEKGDTLYSICRKYNITITQLRDWNTLASDNISVGQRLIVKGR